VYDEEDWRDWSVALGDTAACWIRVSAPLPTLEAREAERAGYFRGLARGRFGACFGKHDLEVDTGSETADSIARRILASLRT
jgi:chloramphenicol 3-O-phosphotransferase